MQFILMIFFMVFISQASLAIVNVTTPTPPPPNVSFPNFPDATTKPTVKAPISKDTASKNDYFETLFDEVEVAKQTLPPLSEIKLYDKLAKESIAYGVLDENPNLLVGPLTFRPLSTNAPHTNEIRKGQELLTNDFGNKSYTYKEMTDLIDQQISNPKSPYTDTDWVLMSNAFRTLKAPGDSHKAHILGGLLSEYTLLGEIKKFEKKDPITDKDRSFLSSLHYDLSQLYQSMYRNDENLFNRSSHGQLSLPIDPIYRENEPGLGYPSEYVLPFDSLVGTRLDLLENALLFDPFDDYSWAQLIDFAAFDLVDPWFFDQLSSQFWEDYFPFGFDRDHADRLRHRWNEIRHNPDVRENRNIRANTLGGERALRRMAVVHARPSSHLNRTIERATRGSPTATQAAPLRSQHRTGSHSGIGANILGHTPLASLTSSKPTSHRAIPHTPVIPHHATTQRAKSPASFFKGGGRGFHGGGGSKAVAHGGGAAPAKKRP